MMLDDAATTRTTTATTKNDDGDGDGEEDEQWTTIEYDKQQISFQDGVYCYHVRNCRRPK